ncbi:MAG: tRNA lysidine(34) synthetase TilS [Clostridia bacterium]|nr:tRNA lysidine(34) synthetase TilS [Clostridia bacterium]
MSFTEILLARAQEANKKFALFSETERVLVGFSGGADSLALLCVLYTILGENVLAFHVNHMLRGDEADADERFCKNFCAERNIPFSSVRIDVASLSRGSAVEETARNARYAALAEECRRVGATKIALAHTASDNTETVLFNLSRGTALAGLRGIPPKRPCGEAEIIRPLILCTREEIEGYVGELGLGFCTDATNSDVHYRRNFIRHEIVPKMRELNHALHTRVGAMCESLRTDEDFIMSAVHAFMEENCVNTAVSAQKLALLHKAVRTRVYAAMFGNLCENSLEEKHFADIEALLESGKNGARIILPGKNAAVLENGELSFMKDERFLEKNEKKYFKERIPCGACEFDGAFATLLYPKGEPCEKTAAELAKNAVFSGKVLLAESTVRNMYVRNRENGDKYVFGGMTRTLKKLLSGGTETAKKSRPVFCDENGIFWFPGFRLRDDIYNKKEKMYILHYFEY